MSEWGSSNNYIYNLWENIKCVNFNLGVLLKIRSMSYLRDLLNTALYIMCSPQVQHLTLMGMELHARTRRDLEPDPEFDPICALFYCISSDASMPDTIGTQLTGAIVINGDHQDHNRGEHFFDHCSVGSVYDQCDHTDYIMPSAGPRRAAPLLVRSGVSGLQVTYVTDEKELFQELVTIMRR